MLGRLDEARSQFRIRLAVIEDYTAADPTNTLWQVDLVLCLNTLAQIGDEPRQRYERILVIMRRLERDGKLTADQASWITAAERLLASLPN